MKFIMSVFVGLLMVLFAVNQADATLVAYWPMDEGSGTIVNDASGHGLNGTISGAIWTDSVYDYLGSALDFDGIDNYVQINNPGIDLSSNQITEEAWVILYGDGTAGAANPGSVLRNFLTIADGWDRYQFGIKIVLGTYRVRAQVDTIGTIPDPITGKFGNSYVEAVTTTALVLNTWYHVACTYDGLDLKVYVNGTLAPLDVAQYAVATNPNPNPSYVLRYDFNPVYTSLGAAIGGFGSIRSLDGTIDEVAIYNTALTASEISQHFADTIPPVVVITHPVDGTTLNSAVVTVAGSASDGGTGVASVKASINEVDIDYDAETGTFGGQVLHTLQDFTITVTATDMAGNTGSDAVTVSMQHDQGLHKGQQ